MSLCERALTLDADHPAIHELLARLFWQRFLEAEEQGDSEAMATWRERLRPHDRAGLIASLEAPTRVSLATKPHDVIATAQRVDRSEPVWRVGPPADLGRAPLIDHELAQGSWLLTLHFGGHRYSLPLLAGRNPVRRLAPPIDLPLAHLGPDWTYVAAGPFRPGGDPGTDSQLPADLVEVAGFWMAVYPTTLGEYLDFLNDLHRVDPDAAWARVPRSHSVGQDDRSRYLVRPEPGGSYVLPAPDDDGTWWQGDWPVFGIDWYDAEAFAAWTAEQTGLPVVLPTELQWEKAARGGDGRLFPWGDEFDPSLCKMNRSRAEGLQPEPVGTFEQDTSVYGVRDLAGTIREWCAGDAFDGDSARRAVRGARGASANEPADPPTASASIRQQHRRTWGSASQWARRLRSKGVENEQAVLGPAVHGQPVEVVDVLLLRGTHKAGLGENHTDHRGTEDGQEENGDRRAVRAEVPVHQDHSVGELLDLTCRPGVHRG